MQVEGDFGRVAGGLFNGSTKGAECGRMFKSRVLTPWVSCDELFLVRLQGLLMGADILGECLVERHGVNL